MAPSPPSSSSSRPPRAGLVAVGALLVLCVLYALATAPLHAATSPSAERVAALFSLTSLSSPLDALRLARTDPADLSYRRELERATAPSPPPVAKPLGFDHVYVLSLPSREDRRADMRKLARALDIDIEFVDAANKDEPFIKWIAERVVESRDLRRNEMAKARKVDPASIGGLGLGSDWLTPFPGNLSSASSALPAPFPPYPPSSFPGSSSRPQTWVAHLEALHSAGGRHTSLRPSNARLNVTRALWDPQERVAVRQVHEGVISTYWGQTRALKRVLENGDATALILEDDVDVEWDVERLWETVARRLPRTEEGEEDWDVAFLGHCWGGEFQQPMYLHPLLHRSTAPMCLHGYAVTARGAARLLDALLDPWRAYSAAVDALVPTLLHLQRSLPPPLAHKDPFLRSWTVAPPLVVQRKDGPSDLQRGTGSKWRGVLRDSAVERIARDEGTWDDGWDERYDEERPDPATVLRCGQG
ncbi:hypothetical protein JCM10450v2_006869 [Rhodotorula kratochvilovae]